VRVKYREKNSFAEASKNLARYRSENIFVIVHQNYYIEALMTMLQKVILATSFGILHNYFEDPKQKILFRSAFQQNRSFRDMHEKYLRVFERRAWAIRRTRFFSIFRRSSLRFGLVFLTRERLSTKFRKFDTVRHRLAPRSRLLLTFVRRVSASLNNIKYNGRTCVWGE